MDLFVVLLLAGVVWAIVLMVALALGRAASRADAEAEDHQALQVGRTGEVGRAGEVVRANDLARAGDRINTATL
jgi:membrane protein implicated in regulation of membrane protease activity